MDLPVRVCVADVRGVITLLQGTTLEITRSWDVGGKITSGPFVRGNRVGCVVDGRRLVWIDPAKDRVAWEYASAGEGIVGQPQVIDNLVVVADQAGSFVGLDPASGKPRGKTYTLKASVAPAAAPQPFGSNRALVSLTDGTLIILSLDRLR